MSASQKDIIQAGSDNHLPMLSRGSYTQWPSPMQHFIEDKPEGDLIWHCIQHGLYKRREVTVLSTSDPPTTRIQEDSDLTDVEKAQIKADKRVIHLVLQGLPNEIFSSVDSYPNAKTIWEAVERLMQEKEVGKQEKDVLYLWEYEKLTFCARGDNRVILSQILECD